MTEVDDDKFGWHGGEVTIVPPTKKNADAKSLYVCRKVLNSAQLVKWAMEQGLSGIKDDLHVTLIYSKKSIQWKKVIDSSPEATENIMIEPSRLRWIEYLGPEATMISGTDKVIAICIKAPELQLRNKGLRMLGCSDGWLNYQPHVTIAVGVDGKRTLADVKPYAGPIVLGPEQYDVVKEDR